MKDYYRLLNINQDFKRQEIADYLHEELRTWTSRTSNPLKEKRDKADEMVKLINEAMPIFEDEKAYNDYIYNLSEQRKAERGANNQNAPRPQPSPRPQPKSNNNDSSMTVDEALEKARGLMGYDDNEAYRLIDKAIKATPKYPAVWKALGDYYKNRGEYDNAKDAYYKIFSIEDKDYDAAYSLLVLCTYTNDKRYLEEMYKIVYEPIKDKNSVYAHFIKGVYYECKNDLDKAIEFYEAAYKLGGDIDTFHGYLTVEPYDYIISNANLKNEVARMYYKKALEYAVPYEDNCYLTTKKDVYNYIANMEKAISYDNDEVYTNLLQNAKDLLKKTEPVELIWKILGVLALLLVETPVLKIITAIISFILPFMKSILNSELFALGVFAVDIYLVKTFMKVEGYLANGAMIAGTNKFIWALQSKLSGEKRPKRR